MFYLYSEQQAIYLQRKPGFSTLSVLCTANWIYYVPYLHRWSLSEDNMRLYASIRFHWSIFYKPQSVRTTIRKNIPRLKYIYKVYGKPIFLRIWAMEQVYTTCFKNNSLRKSTFLFWQFPSNRLQGWKTVPHSANRLNAVKNVFTWNYVRNRSSLAVDFLLCSTSQVNMLASLERTYRNCSVMINTVCTHEPTIVTGL